MFEHKDLEAYDYVVNNAIKLALESHKHQSRLDGENYIYHPLRIMLQCQNNFERVIAVLHDVIEDNRDIRADLSILHKALSLPAQFNSDAEKEIERILLLLTKTEGESYKDYILRISKDEIATKIKILDLRDNLSNSDNLENTMKNRLRAIKYADAIVFLRRGIWPEESGI
jgi:(p)ppGpp synthase/HD superfamily hydrolase